MELSHVRLVQLFFRFRLRQCSFLELLLPLNLRPLDWLDFIETMGRFLRGMFYRSDHAVRIMVLLLAWGGSALICKYEITGFSLLPKYADVVTKRLGAFL